LGRGFTRHEIRTHDGPLYEKEKEKNVPILGRRDRLKGSPLHRRSHIAGLFEGTIDAPGALVFKKAAAFGVLDYVRLPRSSSRARAG
jgi:hypothetical protein